MGPQRLADDVGLVDAFVIGTLLEPVSELAGGNRTPPLTTLWARAVVGGRSRRTGGRVDGRIRDHEQPSCETLIAARRGYASGWGTSKTESWSMAAKSSGLQV